MNPRFLLYRRAGTLGFIFLCFYTQRGRNNKLHDMGMSFSAIDTTPLGESEKEYQRSDESTLRLSVPINCLFKQSGCLLFLLRLYSFSSSSAYYGKSIPTRVSRIAFSQFEAVQSGKVNRFSRNRIYLYSHCRCTGLQF